MFFYMISVKKIFLTLRIDFLFYSWENRKSKQKLFFVWIVDLKL
jgi:hypothetical protein